MPRFRPANAVFLNVPFDAAYRSLFEALVFCVTDCAFVPRCALEASDAGDIRVEKIARIIADCEFGVHDISRTEPDRKSRLPRFNMCRKLRLDPGELTFNDYTWVIRRWLEVNA